MNLLEHILTQRNAKHHMLAILVDPEKTQGEKLTEFCVAVNAAQPDFIFVGGSTCKANLDAYTDQLHAKTKNIPVVLFPGDVSQFSAKADALLFLSLISGRNADLLIGRQVQAAQAIRASHIETISMGYILCDGQRVSAVERVSGTKPLNKEDEIVSTAVAGEMLGMQSIYLEAGSGAKIPISSQIIRSVREQIKGVLIVGGGICSISDMRTAYEAGADIVVIGNYFEQHIEQLKAFCAAR